MTVVLRFGDRRIPRPLRRLAVHDVTEPADVDAVTETAQRVVVLGGNADLATVLTRLLRTERLGVEVAPVTRPWRARRRGARRRPRRAPNPMRSSGIIRLTSRTLQM